MAVQQAYAGGTSLLGMLMKSLHSYRASPQGHAVRRASAHARRDAPGDPRNVGRLYKHVVRLLRGGETVLCGICDQPIKLHVKDKDKKLEIDHIVPIKDGGTHDPENLQPSHHKCNNRKGARRVTKLPVSR